MRITKGNIDRQLDAFQKLPNRRLRNSLILYFSDPVNRPKWLEGFISSARQSSVGAMVLDEKVRQDIGMAVKAFHPGNKTKFAEALAVIANQSIAEFVFAAELARVSFNRPEVIDQLGLSLSVRAVMYNLSLPDDNYDFVFDTLGNSYNWEPNRGYPDPNAIARAADAQEEFQQQYASMTGVVDYLSSVADQYDVDLKFDSHLAVVGPLRL